MKTRLFDHIDLRVRDIDAARTFYEQVLPAIGFTEKTHDDGALVTFSAPGGGKPEFFDFSVDPAQQPNETRIAFWADSRTEVDRVAEVVRRAGGLVLEGPELCEDYTPDYYAFFFEDPDGNKLEICYRSAPQR